jgi:hypothetical protein
MMANVNNYTTLTLHGDIVDNGAQKVMLNATVRAGKYLQLHLEILDPEYVQANVEAVETAVDAFIKQACATATQNGIPTGTGA